MNVFFVSSILLKKQWKQFDLRYHKALFTDRCRWQNFRPSLLRLVDRLYIVIHKTQKTRTKVLVNANSTLVVKLNFSFIFWENWRYPKDISKLIDLYFYSAAICKNWSFQSQLFSSAHSPIRWVMKFHYYLHAKMIYTSDFKIKGPFLENKYS